MKVNRFGIRLWEIAATVASLAFAAQVGFNMIDASPQLVGAGDGVAYYLAADGEVWFVRGHRQSKTQREDEPR